MPTREEGSLERHWGASPLAAQAELPGRLRLLAIAPCEPSWVNLTLQLDAQRCVEPRFVWVSTGSEALAVLRDESFDCILFNIESESQRDDGSRTDSIALVQAIRASGYDDPIVLMAGSLNDAGWKAACTEDCEVLITERPWESCALVPIIQRAMSRSELSRDNQRLAIGNHRRLLRERDEAEQLLKEQRQIIAELETFTEPFSIDEMNSAQLRSPQKLAEPKKTLPRDFDKHYDELLRAYVIMGSGNLAAEIASVAHVMSTSNMSPRETLQFHLTCVETLVRGLGNRSTRHVMARSDLMALEVLVHLGEGYREECRTRASL